MNKKDISHISAMGLLVVIIISIITSAAYAMLSKNSNIKISTTDFEQLSDEWTLNGKEFAFPGTFTIEKNEIITFTCTLPEHISEYAAMMYNCTYMSQEVYVEDELIYSFADKKPLDFGEIRGNAIAIIPLKESYSGKQLTIKMSAVFEMPTIYMSGIFYGSEGEMKFATYSENIWRVNYGLAFLGLSIFLLIYGLIHYRFTKQRQNARTFCYFSVFIGCVSAWILTDPGITQFFTDNAVVMQHSAYVCLLLVGATYLGVCTNFLPGKNLVYHIIEIVGYITIVAINMLYVLNIADVYTFSNFVGIYLVTSIVSSFVLIIRNISKYYYAKVMFIGAAIIGFGTVFSEVLFTLSPFDINVAKMVTISFGTYILVMFLIMFHYEWALLKSSTERDVYEELAYVDKLTGLGNRAAFEHAVDVIENSSGRHEVILFVADLNFLKKINDKQGHDAGDELIRAAGSCFDKAFDKDRKAFRLGGDEFAALVVDSEHNAQHFYNKLYKNISTYQKKTGNQISLAISHVSCVYPDDNKDIRGELFREADKKMYEVKQEMKHDGRA